MGFMFLNAASFYFNGLSGSNYMGHINICSPDLINSIKRRKRWILGLNAGIMKIDYSKGGDSINKTFYSYENILIKPLDSIVTGAKYLNQFNQYITTSKNTAWSFYIQPTLRLLYQAKTKIYFHCHAELLINKWTTNTTVTNIQQDTAIVNPNSNLVYRVINKFATTTSVPFTSTSIATLLSGYFGFGLTFDLKPWEGATVFTQPTFGWTLNYQSPDGSNPNTLQPVYQKSSNIFYLTRIYMKQKLSTTLEAVFGVDIRGKFSFDQPSYPSYLGLNVSLNGLKTLLQQ